MERGRRRKRGGEAEEEEGQMEEEGENEEERGGKGNVELKNIITELKKAYGNYRTQ